MNNINTILLSISLLMVLSILIAKLTKNIGVPVLLLFIGIGMFAGSEGFGGIYFDNARTAQNIGIISLVFILFSGGLETKWKTVQPVLRSSISLATIGVVITTLAIGSFVHVFFHLSFMTSLLLGAVVSSTDAAAVFSIMSFRNLRLKGHVKPLLEMESGTNDPMAVFLTISLIELITSKEASLLTLSGFFILQMALGFLLGVGGGKITVLLINRLKFPIEGFYTVFTLACAVLIYALTASLEGSGFLAVYVAGVIIGNNEIVYRKTLFRFFDGLAWLAQIGMFLTLGLLVFPSHILPVVKTGLLISLFLIFIARPIGVFVSLHFSRFSTNEKLLISWVGLRGAVPIILATFPLIAKVDHAEWIFNVVFFIVLTSALLQGWTTPFVARLLKLKAPGEKHIDYPLEFNYPDDINMKLVNLMVPDNKQLLYKPLVQIPQLKGSLIVTISRNGNYFVPSGSTMLEYGDVIQVLTDNGKIADLKTHFSENILSVSRKT
jgi:cell volume regulation protein A